MILVTILNGSCLRRMNLEKNPCNTSELRGGEFLLARRCIVHITSTGNDGPKIAGASGRKRGDEYASLFFAFCEVDKARQ